MLPSVARLDLNILKSNVPNIMLRQSERAGEGLPPFGSDGLEDMVDDSEALFVPQNRGGRDGVNAAPAKGDSVEGTEMATPTVEWALFCERIAIESGQLDVYGVADRIEAAAFPIDVKRVDFAVELEEQA